MTESSTRPLKVFLCHSSGDKSAIRELYRQLTAEGWMDIWLDEMKLLPGQEWDWEIEKAVEDADIVLVCLSTRSVDKEGYVQKELRFALNIADEKPEGSIFVIPLRLDDCIVPRRLRHWQWVDYFPKEQKTFAYTRLLESFKVRARKLCISYGKPKVEPTPKPVEKAPINPAQDKPAFVVVPMEQKEDKPKPERKVQPKVIVSAAQVFQKQAGKRTLTRSTLYRLITSFTGGLAVTALCIWGGINIWNSLLPAIPVSTRLAQPTIIQTSKPVKTNTLSPTKTSIPLTATISITAQPTPILRVINAFAGGGGAHIREVPNGKILATVLNGTVVTVIPNETQMVNGIIWVHVVVLVNDVRVEGWMDGSVLINTVTPP